MRLIGLNLFGLTMCLLFGALVACGGEDDSGGDTAGAGHSATPAPGTLKARNNIPEEYAKMKNPLEATPENIAAGQNIYKIQCARCHGPAGHGNGPDAAALNPAPAHLAHADVQDAMSDGYIYWRIVVGGVPADNSDMTAFEKSIPDEKMRWQVVSYVRSLKGK